MAQFEELLQVHNESLNEWSKAFETGDTTRLESYPSETYQGVFCYADTARVEPTDRDEATSGLRQFATAFKGASHSWENRVIRPRHDDEVVVFYERVLERGSHSMRFFVTQTWNRTSGEWKLIRELAENL